MGQVMIDLNPFGAKLNTLSSLIITGLNTLSIPPRAGCGLHQTQHTSIGACLVLAYASSTHPRIQEIILVCFS